MTEPWPTWTADREPLRTVPLREFYGLTLSPDGVVGPADRTLVKCRCPYGPGHPLGAIYRTDVGPLLVAKTREHGSFDRFVDSEVQRDRPEMLHGTVRVALIHRLATDGYTEIGIQCRCVKVSVLEFRALCEPAAKSWRDGRVRSAQATRFEGSYKEWLLTRL